MARALIIKKPSQKFKTRNKSRWNFFPVKDIKEDKNALKIMKYHYKKNKLDYLKYFFKKKLNKKMINKIKLVLNQLKKLVSLKLSIITVVLNSKSALEKTIKSISNQDFKNFEYIIIDGKSTDGTQEIIKKYSHFIDKYISEEDNGLYYAMNKGINLAIGEAILFLNAGDLLCKQALSENIKIPSLIPVYYNNYRDKQLN